MDQLASLNCTAGHALFCDMRTLRAEPVPLDLAGQGLVLLVIDTRAEHQHAGGEYGKRRQGCERAAVQLEVGALRDIDDLDAALTRLPDDELRRYVRHVVTENQRVLETVALLREKRVREIGPILSASHASLRDDYQVSAAELDVAVDAAEAAGALGARMTGGGFGGAAIALVQDDDAEEVSEAVRAAFASGGFRPPRIFAVLPSEGAHPVS
jgi:galactokinase